MRPAIVAAALLLSACSGDDEVLPPDARVTTDGTDLPDDSVPEIDADTTDAGPPADAAPCVVFGGGVREDVPGMPFPTLPPLADVSVRALVDGVEVGQTTSAADGSWSLCVPPNSDVALVEEKVGFYNQVFLQVVATTARYLDVRMFHQADGHVFWDPVGATFPSTADGFLTVLTLDPTLMTGIAGASASLSPVSGTGPFYWDAMFMYDPGLTETTTGAVILFANVQPGLVDVVVDHATLTCAHEQNGFASPTPGALRVPVVAGAETSINMKCE